MPYVSNGKIFASSTFEIKMSMTRLLRAAQSRCQNRSGLILQEGGELRRGRRRQREHRIDRLSIARGAELLGDVLVAEQAGDAGQRLEVIGTGAFGGEQQED